MTRHSKGKPLDRREFLTVAAGSLAGAALSVPASSMARVPGANDRISIGIIGCGNRITGVYRLLWRLYPEDVVLAAVAIRPFMAFLQRIKKHLTTVERIMGLMLIITGIMFLTGTMTWIGQWMLETFPALAELEGAVMTKDLQKDIMGRGR